MAAVALKVSYDFSNDTDMGVIYIGDNHATENGKGSVTLQIEGGRSYIVVLVVYGTWGAKGAIKIEKDGAPIKIKQHGGGLVDSLVCTVNNVSDVDHETGEISL